MKLLLIGGSGQLSGRLAEMALMQGHEVWAVTRGKRPLPAGVHALVADRSDAQALVRAVSGLRFDAVLDCVCMNAAHAQIDLSVLSGAASRLVIVSTDSVYHPLHKTIPQTEVAARYLTDGGYGANKREMEQVFLASGENWTIFRPGHIFGPGFLPGCFPEHSRQPELLDIIRREEPLRLYGGGELLIHPIYVDDLAQAMLDCIPNPKTFREIFCIGGPEAVPNRRYYEILGELTGHPVTIEAFPMEGALERHPEYSGHLTQRSYDLGKLRLAGVPLPATTLREGLRRQIEWLDQKGDHP